MKDLPIGIQTFNDIIAGNYLYVDKTKYIYNLFAEKGKYYFLSRPRQFGKSLLISVLKEIFSGNKKLFKGLWIHDKLSWQKHIVITLDFMKISYYTPETLRESLKRFIYEKAASHELTLGENKDCKQAFVELIEKLSVKGKIVLLIDDYDKPIFDFIEDKKIAAQNMCILKYFYSALKGLDEYLQFVFITGVTKFSKISVFSDLDNLNDISLDDNYAAMLGFTHRELLTCFTDRLEKWAGQEKKEEYLEDIHTWYGGYSWDGENFLYNPSSILHLFQKKRFANYWFESASPAFLVKLIKKYNVDLTGLEHYQAGEDIFNSFDMERMNVVSILFHTGYLTVKSVQTAARNKRFYILSYPNAAVKEAFLGYLLKDFAPGLADRIDVIIDDLKSCLETDDISKFFKVLRSFFTKIPYDMFEYDRKDYYRDVLYLIIKLLGIHIETAVEIKPKRITGVFYAANTIYIMGFKPSRVAMILKRIREKDDIEKYAVSSKQIVIIGVGIDPEGRYITDYKVKRLKKKFKRKIKRKYNRISPKIIY